MMEEAPAVRYSNDWFYRRPSYSGRPISVKGALASDATIL